MLPIYDIKKEPMNNLSGAPSSSLMKPPTNVPTKVSLIHKNNLICNTLVTNLVRATHEIILQTSQQTIRLVLRRQVQGDLLQMHLQR